MRYLPHTPADRQAMLGAIGVDTIDALYRDVPADVRVGGFDGLSDHMGELEVERHLATMAGRNLPAGAAACFLGAGAYRHHVPASVDHLIQRSEFLTAYTPYQPEISQGTLQMLFEFQSQVALITGMEVANASMYDGASACAEAAMMALRLTRRGRVVLSGGLHPHYRDTTQTMARFTHFDVAALPANVAGDEDLVAALDDDTACVVVQNPDVFGRVRDLSALAAAVHERGALLVVAFTEAVSLGALRSPGAMGADIVVGEGQSIGNGLNFGGPYLGLFAARQKFVRQMPGRLCGQTTDADGRRGFVLTLSTREQHIRRDKATSNICTNSGLCALAFCIHLSLLGEQGFTRLAQLNHARAVQLAESLEALDGVELLNQHFFNEVTVRLPRPAAGVADALAARNVLGGVPASRLFAGADGLDDLLILAATETNTDEDIAALTTALQEVL